MSHLTAAVEAIKREAKHDPVNHPLHYAEGAIECIDAIEAALGTEGTESYLTGQVLKYTWRWTKKHPGSRAQDLQKAQWYLTRLIATALVNDAQNIGPDYEMPLRAGK